MTDQHSNPETHYPHEPDRYDEIDLADVALAIWRRRWLFLATFALVFGLSLVYALVKTPQYEFRTTLQIGYISDGRQLQPIEGIEVVRHRLEQVHIPQVQYEYRQQNPEAPTPPEIKVTTPEAAGIITLTMPGPAEHAERNLGLLREIVDRVKLEHDLVYDLTNTEREARLTAARNDLESLKAEEAAVSADLERVERKAELVEANIESLRDSVEESETQRQRVAEAATDDQKAMTLLLIDSQIQQERRELQNMEERLMVDLERERDQLAKQLSNLKRSQENQEMTIASLLAKEQAMERTRAVIPPAQSLDPAGPGKALILALGFVLAGMIALFTVSLSALISRTRRKMAEEGGQP